MSRLTKCMEKLSVAVVSSFILFLLVANIYITVKDASCFRSDHILDEVVSYDRNDEEIYRNQTVIAGGIRLNPVFLLIGVPTIYREYNKTHVFYLADTLWSMIKPLTPKEKESIQFLVVLADTESEKRGYILDRLTAEFEHELSIGLINVIGIPERYYLQLRNLHRTFNDSPERLYWRSKQVLDYTFIFNYVHNLCQYYMQVEDDVKAEYDYYHVIRHEIAKHNRVQQTGLPVLPWQQPKRYPWIVLEFYKMGFIGRVIPSFYLPLMSTFCRLFYDQIPVDWLYPNFVRLTGGVIPPRTHDLFTHMGKQSSSLGT